MIPQHVIDDVLSQSDIMTLIGRDVKLVHKGHHSKGLCPFHNEKTPSFSVDPAKQVFHCFGCGAKGNAISYVMQRDNVGFIAAVKDLAETAGVSLEDKRSAYQIQQDDIIHTSREALFSVNAIALEYFLSLLASEPNEDTAEAHAYLNARFTPDQITDWNICLAPSVWDGLLTRFREYGVLEETFLSSGLVRESEKTGKLYDFFRDRIIFPVFNLAGRIIGFNGRVYKADDTNAKYINSAASLVFNKSEMVYGINHAYASIRKENKCNLVEGFTDVISLHTAGLRNTVSCGGTAITDAHLRLIGYHSKNINLILDGDAAGISAAIKTAALAYEQGFNVTTTILPFKEDPDSLIKHYYAAN